MGLEEAYKSAAFYIEGHWEVLRDDDDPSTSMVEGILDKLNRIDTLTLHELSYLIEFLKGQEEDIGEEFPDLKPTLRFFEEVKQMVENSRIQQAVNEWIGQPVNENPRKAGIDQELDNFKYLLRSKLKNMRPTRRERWCKEVSEMCIKVMKDEL